jgi:hypothetical protein
MEILRDKFVDRLLSASDLAVLADMLRRWFLANAIDAEQSGEFQIAAWIFSFPQQRRKELIRSLSARVPEAVFDDTDPDHVTAVDPAETVEYSSQIILWRDLLVAPEIKQACLLLRMTFRGFVKNSRNHPEQAVTTLVLCGAPADGALLLKAVWQEGLDQGIAMGLRLTRWLHETRLMQAFDLYLKQSGSGPRDVAARQAHEHFRGECPDLFISQGDERRVMRLLRRQVETMDERGPTAFTRRLGVPLLVAVGLSTLALFCARDFPLIALPCVVGAVSALTIAGRVAWLKFALMRRYFTQMRKTFGALHSAPIEYQQIDLSTVESPTLFKYTTELKDFGARHVCDLTAKGSGQPDRGIRYYVTDDALIAVGLLHRTERLFYFPPRAVLLVSTRFQDGRRHVTSNTREYRKLRRPNVSRRCVLSAGGAEEVLAAHRRCLDKFISTGSMPLPPSQTIAAIVERLVEQDQENRERWEKYPYSWGDAAHAAFKVCRREYLVD